ncbi:MAG: hypothetical protein Q9212_002021 [Teloschistes hypoglaucus]
MYTDPEKKVSGADVKDDNELESESASDMATDEDQVYSYREQKAIIHRVDRRLVVMCGFLYCFSLIDRGNLGNASIAGMTKALQLDIGFRYSTVVLVFFATYVSFQPLAAVLIRKVGPRMFLSTISLLWGITVMGFGFVNKYKDMVGLRVVLGIFESGIYPGIAFLLSTWYTRYDVGKRFSVFYIIGCIANAFGGILAYGFMQMDGLGGKAGWRWIFIMEGLLTVVVAVIAFMAMVDFPDQADRSWRFLSIDERDFIIRRINRDRGDATPEPFSFSLFLKPALDVKLWIFALISFAIRLPPYHSQEWSGFQSRRFTMPNCSSGIYRHTSKAFYSKIANPTTQFVLAAILIWFSAYFGDRYHVRGPIIIVNCLIALIGLPIMSFAKSNGVRYFGVFLLTAGSNANVPTSLAYQANNIRGQWTRAFSSALFVGFAGMGGISGGTIFRSQDKPRYVPGVSAAIT